ncbi:MAG: hypothetical protein WC503_00715 [Candidatus Shapirobacteria bacterium]
MKTKFYNYLLNYRGEPVSGAIIHVYAYPLAGGSATYANIYITQAGSPTTSYATPIITDANGYFEFFVADLEEGGSTYGYEYQRLFKITWSGSGITAGNLDNLQLFDVTRRSVDTNSTSEYYSKVVNNALAKGWQDHKTDVSVDEHTQYLKTNGSRLLTGNWDIGPTYSILAAFIRGRSATDLNISNYNSVNGLTILNSTGAVQIPLVDINGGAIDGTIIGGAVPAAGTFTTLIATTGTIATLASTLATLTTANITTGTIATLASTLATLTTANITTANITTANITNLGTVTNGTITNLNSINVNLDGGYIDNIIIGQTVGAAGYFSILRSSTSIFTVNLEATNISTGTFYADTSVKTGTLTVSGNTILGDVIGDSVTINAGTVSIPNSLNFDTNTLFIDSTNNRVVVGNSAGTRKFEIVDAAGPQLRLLYSTGIYSDLETTSLGDFQVSSLSTSGIFDLSLRPKFATTYSLGTGDYKWTTTYTNTLEASAAKLRGDGWLVLGQNTTPTAPLDVIDDSIRIRTSKTPATSAAAGYAGQICWDGSYVYLCFDTNKWRRVSTTNF